MQRFLEQSNPWALHAIADRLLEAADRGLWEQPAPDTLDALREVRLKAEAFVEARGERARATIMTPPGFPVSRAGRPRAAEDWRCSSRRSTAA